MRKPHKHTIKGKISTKEAMTAAFEDMKKSGVKYGLFYEEWKILNLANYDNIIYGLNV